MVSVLLTPLSPSDVYPEDDLQVDLESLFNELTAAETLLKRQLCGTEEVTGDYRTRAGMLPGASELFIPSNVSWKDRFTGLGKGRKSTSGVRPSMETRPESARRDQNEAIEMLIKRKIDLVRLWKSPIVQELLNRRGIRLEQSPGL